MLRLLLLWQRLLPAALSEANVAVERLLPQQPLALRPQHQLLLLDLLLASADDTVAASMATAGAPLLPPLRLLVGSPHATVRSAARRWLLHRLLATAAFAGNEEEAVLWLDLLPRSACCRAVCVLRLCILFS